VNEPIFFTPLSAPNQISRRANPVTDAVAFCAVSIKAASALGMTMKFTQWLGLRAISTGSLDLDGTGGDLHGISFQASRNGSGVSLRSSGVLSAHRGAVNAH